MKIHRILASLALQSMLFAGSPIQKPQWTFDVKAPKTLVEKQVNSTTKVKVYLEFGENSWDAVNGDWAKGNGDASWNSKALVWRHPLKVFSIWINGDLQGIPYEALAGEGDISECEVTSSLHEVTFLLSGGDAGLAYELTLVFRESKRKRGQWILAERMWRQGEFADDVYDKTIYHNDIWDDPNM